MFRKFLYNKIPNFEELCNICFSQNLNKDLITTTIIPNPKYFIKYTSLVFSICSDCGYCFCEKNFYDYKKSKRKSVRSATGRTGDGVTPGREYLMFSDVAQMINKNNLRVLVVGPGSSLDHNLIRKHISVFDCKVADLLNFQETEYYIPLRSGIFTKEKFDIIIVCEVVEHFMDPRREFSNIFSFMHEGSVVVASTCPRLKRDISTAGYPFYYGHTSYYSFKSLAILASRNSLYISLLVPKSVTSGKLMKSKIYMYFTKNINVKHKLDNFFKSTRRPAIE